MAEFERLKQRLKNVDKHSTELRMSITEAKNLIKEFELLQSMLAEKPKEVIIKETYKITNTLDGGSF